MREKKRYPVFGFEVKLGEYDKWVLKEFYRCLDVLLSSKKPWFIVKKKESKEE